MAGARLWGANLIAKLDGRQRSEMFHVECIEPIAPRPYRCANVQSVINRAAAPTSISTFVYDSPIVTRPQSHYLHSC